MHGSQDSDHQTVSLKLLLEQQRMFFLLISLLASAQVVRSTPYQVENIVKTSQFSLLMPNSKPTEPETYLCTTIRLDENNTYFITGFDPQADMGTAHHMLLFGCKEPGQRETLFSCGEMGRILEGTKQAAPCRSGQQTLYAWAKNAPKLDLHIKYLVLQVHYASVEYIQEEGDQSVLEYTDVPRSK